MKINITNTTIKPIAGYGGIPVAYDCFALAEMSIDNNLIQGLEYYLYCKVDEFAGLDIIQQHKYISEKALDFFTSSTAKWETVL